MVLQRNIPIAVWGEATPETKVTVVFNSSTIETLSDINGNWELNIPPQKAGGPYNLQIFEANNPGHGMVFSNILLGDVWLASGQSNMELKVNEAIGFDRIKDAVQNNNIRFFDVPHHKSLNPLNYCQESKWQICDSNTVKSMSAVGYYFVQNLETELDVPIGLIQSTWGGTPVEAWTSREMLLSHPLTKERVLKNDSINIKHFSNDSLDLLTFWDIVYHPKNGSDTIYASPGFDDSKWRTVTVPGFTRDWEPSFYEGMIWLRKTIDLEQATLDYDLSINLGLPEMNYSLYFNGHEICKTQWNANLKHVYTVPSKLLNTGKNTIALRIAALWGGGGLNPPADSIYLLLENRKIDVSGSWKYQKDLEPTIPKIYNYQYYPTYLFNAMINPLIPFGLKGFIWYQGEANEGEAFLYRELFPLLINDWRKRWEQGNLPFLFVQLPNYYKRESKPSDGKWAVMRESQQQALALPNTGMTCIIDLGEADNIHPRNKTDVGIRLANTALKQLYGKDILESGPVLNEYKIEGHSIRISFENIGMGFKTSDGKPIRGFALAGTDQQFYWANAKIDGKTIVVSSENVPYPIAVRYAWANNPDVNLENSAGLPAVPFRTDNWKVLTQEE